jgi:hypothetical protein
MGACRLRTTRMIVFPLIRLVGLKAATASSRVETFPMFVRSRPPPTRRTISLSGSGCHIVSSRFENFLHENGAVVTRRQFRAMTTEPAPPSFTIAQPSST